jgi:hypothetical protein
VLLAIVLLAGCADLEPELDSQSEKLVPEAAAQALTRGAGAEYFDSDEPIPACFLTTEGPDHQQWMKDSIYRTWEFVSGVQFDWEGLCSGTDLKVRVGLVVRNDPDADGWASAVGTAALRDERATNAGSLGSPTIERPSFKVYANDDLTTVLGRMEYLAVHEMGHVLGFAHEQDHPDNEGDCTDGLGVTGAAINDYDHNSVMNYCGDHGNETGKLTGFDIEGAQAVYGIGRRFHAAIVTLL